MKRCRKCGLTWDDMSLAVCDCGYRFTAGDAGPLTPSEAKLSASTAAQTVSGTIIFGALIGGIVGGILGFPLRPAIPLVGQQLPFEAVITRGATLKGLDQLLVGFAQQSFNYLVLGVLICGAAGAFLAHLAKGNAAGRAAATENLIPPTATYEPQAPVRASPSAPVTVQLGDSPEAVVAKLGTPQKVMGLGPKALYVYPDVKITFVDEMVSDVE